MYIETRQMSQCYISTFRLFKEIIRYVHHWVRELAIKLKLIGNNMSQYDMTACNLSKQLGTCTSWRVPNFKTLCTIFDTKALGQIDRRAWFTALYMTHCTCEYYCQAHTTRHDWQNVDIWKCWNFAVIKFCVAQRLTCKCEYMSLPICHGCGLAGQ